MKLVLGIAHDRHKRRLFDALIESAVKFTVLSSTGGFLRRGNITIMVGVEDDQVERVLAIFQDNCATQEEYVSVPPEYAALTTFGAPFSQAVKVRTGGAVVFVLDVDQFETF
jgi:uncharacterized protein YaaQ